jgi:rod shape-determining protein MreB
MAFLRQELAIDLGTANTVVFKDDQVVLDEPSIIAFPRVEEWALVLSGK